MNLINNKDGKILVLGHRGEPSKEVENTIPSFLKAIEDGADGVELDVRVTLDHHLVVSHDNSLKRVYGVDKKIEESTLSEIREITPLIPELKDVFNALGNILYDIELKGDSPFDFNREVITLTLNELEKREELKGGVMLSSFNPILMHILGKKSKNKYPMAIIYSGRGSSIPPILQHGFGRHFFSCTALKSEWKCASEEKKRHPSYPICPWTVDTRDAIKEMITLDVPLLITNDSEMTVKTLQELGRR